MGWDIDFNQIEAGQMHTKVEAHAGPDCILTNVAMSKCVHQRGAPPEGWMTFGIPDASRIKSWQSKTLDTSSLLTFGTRDGFDSVSDAGHRGLVMAFDKHKILQFAQSCGFELPDSVERTEKFVGIHQFNRLRRLEATAQTMLSSQQVQWTPRLVDNLLLDLTLIITDDDISRDTSSPSARQKVLSKAIALMRDSEQDVVPISKICAEAGGSWRTIERAFRDKFGIGPKAYYNRLRLNKVRQELLYDPNVNAVNAAANKYGFWHMGQFARDYRKLFDQLPSETLSGRP